MLGRLRLTHYVKTNVSEVMLMIGVGACKASQVNRAIMGL